MSKKSINPGKARSIPTAGPDRQGAPEQNKDVRNILYPVIIILLYLVVYAFIFDSKIDFNGDNASYFTLGKALSSGHGYVNIAHIEMSPENHFPPGYPFLISVVLSVFGESIMAVKLFDGLYIVSSIILIYFIAARITDNKTLAFAISVLLALNSHILLYSHLMMSEPAFNLMSTLTLWMIMNIRDDKGIFSQPALYVSIVALGISYYIRSTGLALFGGIFLWFLIKKNWKAVAFYTAGFFMFALPWYLRGQKLGGSSYIKPLVMINPYRPDLGNASLPDYIARLTSNISRYIAREIPNSSFPFIKVNYVNEISLQEWVLGLIILGIIVFGLIRLKKFRLLIMAYLLATFGILFMWPEVWTGVRFILPVMPLLLISVLFGFYELYTIITQKAGFKTTLSPFVFLFLALFNINPVRDLHKRAVADYPANWKNYFEIAKWIKKQGFENAVVCCRKADLFYLYSDTFVYTYPYTENDQEIISELKDNKVTHVVLDNLGYRQTYAYLLPAIQKNPEHFQTILKLSDPDTYLLKFNP